MDPLPHVLPPGIDYGSYGAGPNWAQAITRDRDTGAPYLLLGCPSDVGIPTRPGARFAPDLIRGMLARLGCWGEASALAPESPLICDLGNVEVAPTAPLRTHERLEAAWTAALTAHPEAFPLTLGGDHSLTAPTFMAYQRFHGHQLGLIVWDAHYDVREWSPEHLTSGTPFRRILELGPRAVSGRNVVYLGIRPFANSLAHHDWITEQGATIFTMRQIRQRGLGPVLTEAIRIASEGTEGIYSSLDIDVVDQGDAPGASATGPGGLRSGELLDGLAQLGASGTLLGFDVMEVSPPCDFQDLTSRLAAHCLATLIASREEAHARA